MRNLILLIAAAVLLLPGVAEAYQVLLLLSTRDRIYTEAAAGFERARTFSQRTIVLSDYVQADLARTIREDKPDVIVAVGDGALAAVRKVHNIPVISVMALSFHRMEGNSANLSGVELFVKPERYFSLFDGLKLKRVGVLYNPARSGRYLKKAQAAAARAGIELVPRVVNSPKEAPGQLERLKGSIDAVWMIPDAAAVDHKSAEAYFLFSMAEKIPVISFDRSHLQLGAAAVLEPDREEMGRQAAEMAADIIAGGGNRDLAASPARYLLKVNTGVFKHLGISADGALRLSGQGKE